MAQPLFYRYVGSQKEMDDIANRRAIRSSNPQGTWYTPDRFESAQEARERLALGSEPLYRVGPIPADEIPDFDVVPLRPVGYVDVGRPGGAVEGCTSGTVYLFAVWDFPAHGFRDHLGVTV